jgi:L-rhamnose mutarotase
MERYGIFFKLKPGKAEGYEKAHAEIWPEMSEALDAAGMRNYSIWREGDMLFAYYEVKNRDRMNKILAECEVYQKWRDLMEEYVYIEPVTGQKEWEMKNVFYHE